MAIYIFRQNASTLSDLLPVVCEVLNGDVKANTSTTAAFNALSLIPTFGNGNAGSGKARTASVMINGDVESAEKPEVSIFVVVFPLLLMTFVP